MNPATLCMSCMADDSGDPVCPKCGRPFDLEAKNSLQLKPRTMLRDQYLIGRALGHGGFGITYLAWDIGLESRLAVKEYMPNGVAGRSAGATKVLAFSDQTKQEFDWGLDRFLEEARVLKKFSGHPGIVSVDTIFRDNGTAYLVMEYLDGVTFEEFLHRRGGKITFETTLRVMLPVIDALSAVHAEGILHRDISPDNIHLTRNGKVKLIDFGAARNALGQKSRNLSIILKEGYAPEEQYRASGVQGPCTDVYATAATMYHAITGRSPQPALDRQAEDKVQRPSDVGVEIEPLAQAALVKALAIRAIDRFQSMEDFKSALTGRVQVLEQGASPPPPPPLLPPPARVGAARPGWMWPAILGAVALIGIGVMLNRPGVPKVTDGGKTGTTSTSNAASGVVDPGGTEKPSGRVSSAATDAGSVGIPKPDYESLINQANQFSKRNDYAQAAELLSRAITLDPNKARAYSTLGELQFYFLNQLPQAVQNDQAAVAHGGVATFHVYHEHGGGNFALSCKGYLYLSKGGVRFAAFDSAHSFQAQRGDIQEAKKNRLIGGIVGRRNVPGIDLRAFHIKLRNGQNYNFAPMSRFSEAERELILSIIGTN
jgi:serine/threonine protein kinase